MTYKTTILITGGTSGLGYHTALALARKHPTSLIIITGRSDPTSTALKINTILHQTNVLFLPLNLTTTTSIHAFAKTWSKSRYPPLTCLLLNAGTQSVGRIELSEEGYEKTFMINHIGHALLFHLLTPYLASKARIVVTASGTHDPEMTRKSGLPDAVYTSAEDLAHPNLRSMVTSDGMQRYNSSKLANVLWTYALARRLAAHYNSDINSEDTTNKLDKNRNEITVNAYTPGLIFGTGLARDWKPVMRFMWFHVLPRLNVRLVQLAMPYVRGVEESSADLAWLAMGDGDEVEGVSGGYFDGRVQVKSSVDSYNVEMQEDLWEWTVRTLRVNNW